MMKWKVIIKLLINLEDGIEMDAFFYPDKMAWTAFYGHKLSHWWNAKSYERLDDVTHWRSKDAKAD